MRNVLAVQRSLTAVLLLRCRAYVLVTVDSHCLKGKSAKGVWDEHFEFELLPTSVFVEFAVFKDRSSDCMGWLQVPISSVIKAGGKLDAAWYKLGVSLACFSRRTSD